MDCKSIQRQLSRYIDDEVTASERMTLEAHVKACALCAAEKKELERLTTLFRQIPDLIPAEHSEEVFWEKVREARKHTWIEKIRSLILEWDFIPAYYPATALLLLGLIIGIGMSKMHQVISHQERLNPSAIQYLALNRMDPIPYNSITGVYLSGVPVKQEVTGSEE